MNAKEMRIRVIMSALDGASGPIKTLSQAARKTKGEINGLKDKLKQIERFTELKKGSNEIRVALSGARERAAALGKTLADTASPTRKLTAEFKAAQREVQALKKKQSDHLQALQRLRPKLQEAGLDTRNLSAAQRTLKGDLDKANRSIEAQNKRLEQAYGAKARADKLTARAGNLAVAGGAMLGAAGVAALPYAEGAKQAMTMEDAMADLNKVANASPGQMKLLADGFTQLSEKLPFTRAQLAAIGADLKRGGVPVAELKDATRQAAELGVALGIPAEEAGAMASKWRSAYKMSRREIQLTGDAVNEITNRFGGNTPEILGMVTRNGALAKAHGMIAGQVAAVAGTMNSAGVGEEVGATGIKNMLLALGKGEAATKQQRQAFKALGLDAVAMSKMLRKDAGGAITLVLDRLSQLPDYQQGAAMDQLFGSESIGAIAPLLTDLDGLKKRLGLVGSEAQYAGSAGRELVNELGKTSVQLQIAGNKKENAFGKLGATFLPELKDIGSFLGDVAAGLGNIAEAHPGMAKLVLGLIAIVGGIGAIMLVVAPFVVAFAALTTAAATLGLTVGAIMLPVLLVVGAIAALLAAGYLLWKNWDWLKAKGAELVNWFKGLPAVFGNIGRMMMEGLKSGIVGMLGPVKDVMNSLAMLLPDSLKKKLGIHSPSRVFAQLGGHVMEGLAVGVRDGQGRPVASMRTAAAALTAAAGVSLAAPALAGGFRPPPALATGAGAAAAPVTVPVTINATPGMDERLLARLVADEVRKALEGRDQSRLRSYFNDNDGD